MGTGGESFHPNPKTMAFTLTNNGLIATFALNGEYVEITRQTKQKIGIQVEECYDEWHGLSRPTGEIATQVITGESWTEVPRAKARQIWKQMTAEGWQPA